MTDAERIQEIRERCRYLLGNCVPEPPESIRVLAGEDIPWLLDKVKELGKASPMQYVGSREAVHRDTIELLGKRNKELLDKIEELEKRKGVITNATNKPVMFCLNHETGDYELCDHKEEIEKLKEGMFTWQTASMNITKKADKLEKKIRGALDEYEATEG